MDGNSTEMEAALRVLPRGEVIEIATRDDGPYALKARAELAKRDARTIRIGIAVVAIAIFLSVGIDLADKL
ncbi:hypothetical protein FHS21_005696 [Phyllobacterium trifolii]|uniref:Uncharacterized protein n=1 Tax=Phyllobacterium trifolii TaxID=300193 RepID=A0A839UHF6_9HYPH|nr:hypothetical protein [Phyllobacterium trifolii]MBB3149244.1 hypothetical protein [Phyllobacterium trifolii]